MKKFLASVGNAKLLGKVGGTYQHIADVRTLTESTLSFSSTQEEVRAGQGAQLYGRFAHDSAMTCTLTDAMFDINYIALQVGADLTANDAAATGFYQEPDAKIGSNGKVQLTRVPQNIGISCGLDKRFIWVRHRGCDAEEDWKAIEVSDSSAEAKEVVLPADEFSYDSEHADKNKICVEYFVDKPNARAIQVKSNFIPAELILLLTTNLFSGDANNPETGKPVGSITVKIPRFSLDGTFDLSMAMSAAATLSLQGSALAVSDGGCDGSGVYAEIVEVIETGSFMDTLADVIVDPDSLEAAKAPEVWGKFTNGSMSRIGAEYIDIYHTTNSFDQEPADVMIAGANYIVIHDIAKTELPETGKIMTVPATPHDDDEQHVTSGNYNYYVIMKNLA